MLQYYRATQAELLKLKRASIVWISFAAFSIGPIMGGLALYIIGNSSPAETGSMLAEKVKMMSFSADWPSFIALLSQVVAVGGILVFGFVASWLFGREYSDNTTKDMLALPTSRNSILTSKFLVYVLWCLALMVSNLILGLLIGSIFSFDGFGADLFTDNIKDYLITSLMVMALGTPVAFMALWGRGYLAPIGLVVLMLVVSQILGAMGLGQYFPWSVPGLYSGVSAELKNTVNGISFIMVALVAVMGLTAIYAWFNRADQN